MWKFAGIRGKFSPNSSPVKCLLIFAPQSSKSSMEENCMGQEKSDFFQTQEKQDMREQVSRHFGKKSLVFYSAFWLLQNIWLLIKISFE